MRTSRIDSRSQRLATCGFLAALAAPLALAPKAAAQGRGGGAPPPPPADPAIAFTGGATIHVMNADGTNVTSLGVELFGGPPAWSPDLDGNPTNGYQGTLAFSRGLVQPISHVGIWLLDVAVVGGVPQGLGLRQIWDPAVREAVWHPEWSPDLDPYTPGFQGMLAYVDFEQEQETLMLLAVAWDGNPTAPSTVHSSQDTALLSGWTIRDPAWSSDGRRIAYANGTELVVLDDLQDPQPRLLASEAVGESPCGACGG